MPPVVVIGEEQDGPVALLLQALRSEGIAHVHAPMSRFDELALTERVSGIYLRPLEAARLYAKDVARRLACQAWIQAWCDLAEWLPARVANRPSAMAGNSSKPFQSQQLARLGFSIPPMLQTDDPAEVRAFEREHGQLIYKSASGVRSIVQLLDERAHARLERVRHCPTLFQKRLRGTNLRVHVVGEQAFATEIECDGLDYRYAGADRSGAADLSATELDPQTRWLCIHAAHALGLPLAGLDLMRAEDGKTYCFEVNPSPGFSWYEDSTGQPISVALARWLGGKDD